MFLKSCMLASVFRAAFGATGVPEVQQKHWPKVSNEVFITGRDTLFNSDELIRLSEEMLLYYTDAMKTQQLRDDYLELLNLCHRTYH